MKGTDLAALRRQSLWFSRATLVLFCATAAIAVLSFGTALAYRGAVPSVITRLAVHWLPPAFYLYALWSVRGAFKAFAGGGVLGTAVAQGCTRAGWALAVGGGLSALGVPNLLRLLTDMGVLEKQGWSGFLMFDVAYLAVGVVGLALVLLGQLLRWAGELEGEAAALRDELGSFF
jgi:hypothetical protein